MEPYCASFVNKTPHLVLAAPLQASMLSPEGSD